MGRADPGRDGPGEGEKLRSRRTWRHPTAWCVPNSGAGDYSPNVRLSRLCSRTACSGGAVATLTYVYSEQTAVLGPLATYAEPHTYDLCLVHAEGMTVPLGWDVIRRATEFVDPVPTQDDLLALADAVREVGLSYDLPAERPIERAAHRPAGIVELTRRGHLTVLADPDA